MKVGSPFFKFYIMKHLKFLVKIYLSDHIILPKELDTLAENIMDGLVYQANTAGLSPSENVYTTFITITKPFEMGELKRKL
jgi:hypothetical protein